MRNSLKYTLLTWALFLSVASATTINVPADYSTIQAALTAADSSDIVLVQPGTYYENIFWPDRNGIKLISAGDKSNTVIYGLGIGSVIYMNPIDATIDSDTEIQGFKITNGGNIDNGGGMFVSNASPVLTLLWITGNTASQYGGGLYLYNSSPALTYVTVTGNTVSRGGGLCISGGSPTLTDVTVTGNTASDDGGGLYISRGSPTLTDVTVSGNTAYDKGGGLYIYHGSPTLTDVTVSDNTASYSGGGLYIIYYSSPTLADVTVTNNSAYSGGGLFISNNSDPTLTHVTVTGNTASYGGGLSISGGSPTLTGVTVSGNTASDKGGGLYIYDYGSPTLTRSTVSRNLGAGLYFYKSSGTLVNVTITGNTSGIYVESGAPTIAGSNIAYHGAGLHNADNTNIVDADSIWWGDSSGPYHPLQNAGGLGDSANTFVNIKPFLTEPDTAAPPIPVQNLTIDSTGYDFVELSWDASPIGDLAGYRIYFDTDSSGFPYTDTIDVDNNTSTSLSGLSTGLTYYIAATCYDTDGNESWYSNEVSTMPKDITAPASPKNLVAEAGDGQIILIWVKNTENDFLRYRIYGGTTASPTTAIDSSESALDTTITISDLNNNTTYYFRITAVDTALNKSDFSNEVSATPTALAVEESSAIPTSFALHPAYPNPFNPTTTIRFDLPNAVDISIVVYDLMGREVAPLVDGDMTAGYHQVIWDGRTASGREVPTGLYIARLVTPEFTKSIKMVLLK